MQIKFPCYAVKDTNKEEKVEARVADLLNKARTNWPQCDFKKPTIEFGLRGRVAGWAYYLRNKIRLNDELFAQNEDVFITQTVGHEVAHIVARQLHSGNLSRPHGIEWQRVMAVFGLPANRCHDYETAPARVHKKYECVCSKCDKIFLFSASRFGKLQRGVNYWHRICQGVIIKKHNKKETYCSRP